MTNRSAGGQGHDVVLLSILTLAMTFLVVRTGLASAVGIVALVVQAGLLIRINYVHRTALQPVEGKEGT
jgi:hypothetical protein